jgi:hypothetical protein
VQVVGPERGGRLEKLAVAPRGAGDGGTAELLERLVRVQLDRLADGADVGARQGQPGQDLVAGGVVDRGGVELGVQPAFDAQFGGLGEGLRGRAEGGAAEKVRDRVVAEEACGLRDCCRLCGRWGPGSDRGDCGRGGSGGE